MCRWLAALSKSVSVVNDDTIVGMTLVCFLEIWLKIILSQNMAWYSQGDTNVVGAYEDYLCELVSGFPVYVKPALHALVKQVLNPSKRHAVLCIVHTIY